MEKANVGIVMCCSYNRDEIYKSVKKAASVCSFPNVEGKKVLVKPNILTDAKPEDCITTNPEVVRAVIKLVKEKGASTVYCGDSPGLQSLKFKGENCGIFEVCKEEGAIWSDFTNNPVQTRINGTGQTLKMARIVSEADIIISVCKFKTHQLMYTTGAVKNLFGTIPGLDKATCHMSNPSRKLFAKLIVGICETVKPAFCVMDAVIGMEGPGPANGKPRPINLIMASENCYAMDEAEAVIMGYNKNDICILNEAEKRNLLPSQIDYPLLKAKDLVIKDFVRVPVAKSPKWISKLIFPFCTRNLQKKKQKKEPAPTFISEKCIKCKRCVNICPAKALILNHENKIEIDTSKCIRCYCCHEMCPVAAIEVFGEKTGFKNPSLQ